MAKAKDGPAGYRFAELREAVQLYETILTSGRTPTLPEFRDHFRCSGARASVLLKAAAFAVKIKQKGV